MSIDHSRPDSRCIKPLHFKDTTERQPVIDTQKPVSRQHEMSYLGYYGYPYYWGGSGVWGQFALPGMLAGSAYGMPDFEYRRVRASAERFAAEAEARVLRNSDSKLRSCNAINHYHVHATELIGT